MSEPLAHAWWAAGEECFQEALAPIRPTGMDEPSLLPDWSRRRVIAHVARNADALVNLLTWARTGVETPMYASPEAREDAIDATMELQFDELRTDSASAARRLGTAVAQLPKPAWTEQVRTAQGRTVPASEVLWMRCREVWVHAVDLRTGVSFNDFPDPLLTALIDDVVGTWQRRHESPDVRLRGGDRTWGAGSITIEGTLPMLAAQVTGRAEFADAGVADSHRLPRWL